MFFDPSMGLTCTNGSLDLPNPVITRAKLLRCMGVRLSDVAEGELVGVVGVVGVWGAFEALLSLEHWVRAGFTGDELKHHGTWSQIESLSLGNRPARSNSTNSFGAFP